MRIVILLMVCFLSTRGSLAQGPVLEWVKSFGSPSGDYATSVAIDNAGNVITIGDFSETIDFDPGPGVYDLATNGHFDVFISKLDAAGNFLWAKSLGETKADVSAAVKVDKNNFIYVAGSFSGTVDFDPGPGIYNLSTIDPNAASSFVLKLDPNGNFLWAISLENTNLLAIDVDANGNLYSTGGFWSMTDFDPGPGTYFLTEFSFNSVGTGVQDVFILKLDALGNFQWVKQMGGLQFDQAWGISLDPFGNILTTGHFSGTADFNPAAGIFNLFADGGLMDVFILKLNANGDFVWAKKVGGVMEDYSRDIETDVSGNVYIGGNFYSTSDFDPGPGTVNFNPYTGQGRMFVLKLDAAGIFVWVKQLGGIQDELFRAMSLDIAGNVYSTGHFKGTVDFDPGPGVYNLTSKGYEDVFISKLDNNGNFIWAVEMGSPVNFDSGLDIKTDVSNNVYTVGLFTGTVDFDPGAGVYDLTAVYDGDAFVQKLNQCGKTTFSTINTSACFTYDLNNQTYTKSGVYRQVLQNVSGCDSIITLNLIINGTIDTLAITACDNYVWNSQTYTTSGFYRDTLTGFSGCDSIINLSLTIKRSVSSSVNITICEGQSYSGHTAPGTYTDNFTGSNGCDSLRTLNLTVRPRTYAIINAAICQGQTYSGYSVPGTYFDTLIAANGCDSVRTIILVVHPTAVTNLNISICQGQTYRASGRDQTTTGVYSDTLQTSFGCDSIIITNLNVNANPLPILGPDKDICAGQPIVFNPGIFSGYEWQDQSRQQIFTATTTGVYWVKVTDNNNCAAIDTVNIKNMVPVPSDFLKQTDSLCKYEKLTIQSMNVYQDYTWSTGSSQRATTIDQAGPYSLIVTDANNCIGKDTIHIIEKECTTGVFIPTAFTPNADGKNDAFKATVHGNVRSFKLQVFDRAGQLIFRTTDPTKEWNGFYKGILQPATTFVWQCSYQIDNGQPGFQKGTVTLIR